MIPGGAVGLPLPAAFSPHNLASSNGGNMVTTTTEIADSLRAMGTRFDQLFANSGWSTSMPMTQLFGWNAPAFSAAMLSRNISVTAEKVQDLTKDQLEADGIGDFLKGLPATVNAVQFTNAGNDWDAVIGGVAILVTMIDSQLPRPTFPKPRVDWEEIKNDELLPRDLMARLRRVESSLKKLEPRSASLDEKIAAIERAHETADHLPVVMADLEEGQEALRLIKIESEKISGSIKQLSDKAEVQSEVIPDILVNADILIKRAEQALRGSTGVGLAAAFEQRKKGLSRAGVIWVVGLAAALCLALVIGAERVATLKDVLISDRSPTVVIVNALLAVLGVGGPIWFAWLSTKQIGMSFRLAEDYAFKASVAKAYEGYRAEAAQIDPELQARLFASALTRLEESPIRLLDTHSHSTPLQEFLNNPAIVKQLERVPNVIEKLVSILPMKGAAAAIAVPAAVAAAAASMSDRPGENAAHEA